MMKGGKVSKTFVREECRSLGMQLKVRYDKKLKCEIEKLATMLQRSLNDFESRITRLESKLSCPKSSQ
jgi:hypothetical protein